MSAPTTHITIVKRFTYRGDPTEEFSNSYALTGSTPADATAWRALFDALVAVEKACYGNAVSVVRGYGHTRIPQKGDHAVWSVDLTVSPNVVVAGTLSVTQPMAGDQAMWVRWKMDRLTSKGKPIYLRKYFHGGAIASGAGDTLTSGDITALNALGAKLRDGSFLDARVITDHTGALPIGHGTTNFVTTRTLKRRPKRPPT